MRSPARLLLAARLSLGEPLIKRRPPVAPLAAHLDRWRPGAGLAPAKQRVPVNLQVLRGLSRRQQLASRWSRHLTSLWACTTMHHRVTWHCTKTNAPAADTRDANRAATPGPAPRRAPLAPRKSTSRSFVRSTEAVAEFHALAGHAGPADGCQDCASAQQCQRSAAAALRTHQRQARHQVDAILGKAATS